MLENLSSIDFFRLLTNNEPEFVDLFIANHSGSLSCAYHLFQEVSNQLEEVSWDKFNTRSLLLFFYPKTRDDVDEVYDQFCEVKDSYSKKDSVTIQKFDQYIAVEIIHTASVVSKKHVRYK